MKSAISEIRLRRMVWLAALTAAIVAAGWSTTVVAGEEVATATAEPAEPNEEQAAGDDEAEAETKRTDKKSDAADRSVDKVKEEGASAAAEKSTAEDAKAGEKPTEQVDKADTPVKDADAEGTNEATERKPAAKRTAEEAKPKPTANDTTASDKPPADAKRNKVRFALLTVSDSLTESAGQVGPFGETQLDLREFVNRLDRAAKDSAISGVILDIQNPGLGRGKIEELRGAIARFRSSDKKIYAQLDSAMPADYLIASACDEIIMPETGMIVLPGIHAEATFYRGLLKKIGVEADFVHIGPYKGAAEPLTREKFSGPVRENMNALVDSLYDDLVTTIVKSRPLSIAQAKDVIDTGLLTAARAKELGLIDRVAYPDVLRHELAESHEAESLVYVRNYGQRKVDTDFSGPMGFFKLMQVMMGTDSRSRRPSGKKIAVVYAVGPIMTGKSERGLFGGQTMGSTTIVEALRKANNDEQVAAIVLRIESPGGSALASDLIWHETRVIEKPIVASMGDVAASGGYYIAMGADKIFAAPGTVTGSIGVVGGKLAVRGLYDKLGITTETIERGKNSGLFGASGTFTESQRAVLVEMMEDIYRQFTTKAAEGRKMPLEKLQELAGGRIYTGRQAKEVGLVDELGTLHDAIKEAKRLAGIGKDEAVRIETLPEPANFFESLFGNLDAEEEVRIGRGALGGSLRGLEALSPELVDLARRAYRLRAVFDQPAALVMPFELEIR